jgi:E3 ubiquitin-protein ligase BOI-like protein
MAVQAQHLSHDLHACNNFRGLPLMDEITGGSLYLDGQVARAPAVFGDIDFAWNDNTCSHGFVQRKRARVAAEAPSFLGNQCAQGLLPVGDVLTRAVGSGEASTSGRMANAAGLPQDLFSTLHHQGTEIDAIIRVEVRTISSLGDWNRVLGLLERCSDSLWYVLQTERMRAGLEESRRRHVRALVSAAVRAAAGRLRAAEAALELARYRNATLSERLGQMNAEGQAWIGVAKSHEAVVVGLRATLDKLLQSPCAAAAEGAAGECEAEDARSCCFETSVAVGGNAGDDGEGGSDKSRAACKACGEGESCVLLLPCRHLCLCPACDAAVDTCPVCAATKNASLHVLLS